MSVIKLSCTDQALAFTNLPIAATGGVGGDSVEFTFCSLWSGYEKTAHFFLEDWIYEEPINAATNRCTIPFDVLAEAGKVRIGVSGDKTGAARRFSVCAEYVVIDGVVTEVEAQKPAAAGGYVRYDEAQSLTDAEQTQARDNIGIDVAGIVQEAVAKSLKSMVPYSIEFDQGALYAPATNVHYSAQAVTDNSITFQYRGGSGVEELLWPITGLAPGRTYTIEFDETYTGGFIQDTYRYGCGIIQKATYDATTFPTSNAKPSWISWHTGTPGTQKGAITFKTDSDTVYWAWSLGRLSDGVLTTIKINARIY